MIKHEICIYYIQDLLYNNKAKSGILYHKIKNTKAKSVKTTSDFNEEDLKNFLKYCVVSKNNEKLKDKLQKTISLRRQLLKENGDDFREFFQFYFVDPSLVCIGGRHYKHVSLLICKMNCFYQQILYDFAITFENVDVEALRRKWPAIRDKIDIVPNSQIDFSSVPTRHSDILKFLQILKVFTTGKQLFSTVAKSFIVFGEVNSNIFFTDIGPYLFQKLIYFHLQNTNEDPMLLVDKKNYFPYIIAILSADKKQFKCYIDVNKFLISVSFS